VSWLPQQPWLIVWLLPLLPPPPLRPQPPPQSPHRPPQVRPRKLPRSPPHRLPRSPPHRLPLLQKKQQQHQVSLGMKRRLAVCQWHTTFVKVSTRLFLLYFENSCLVNRCESSWYEWSVLIGVPWLAFVSHRYLCMCGTWLCTYLSHHRTLHNTCCWFTVLSARQISVCVIKLSEWPCSWHFEFAMHPDEASLMLVLHACLHLQHHHWRSSLPQQSYRSLSLLSSLSWSPFTSAKSANEAKKQIK